MGEDPTAIRQEIEQTRERMGETVDALGYKVDVPSRAKNSISDKVQGVRSKMSGVAAQVSDATPDPDDVKHAGGRAARCRRTRWASPSVQRRWAFSEACCCPRRGWRTSALARSPIRSRSRR